MTPNVEIMRQAREALRGRWPLAAAATLIVVGGLAIINSIPVVGWLANLLLSGPLYVGFAGYFLTVSRGGDPRLDQLFHGFGVVLDALVAFLLVTLAVLVGFVFLIVPGVYLALSFSLVFILMSEDRNLGAWEALHRSWRLMDGHRWEMFCLFCRFIGWFLLCVVTLGLAALAVIPYVQVSVSKFYLELQKGIKG